MKLLFLLLGLLLVGCATTDMTPPEPTPIPPAPQSDLRDQVIQADWDWLSYTSIANPSKAEIASVKKSRATYDKAIQKALESATNYIGLVNELMIPPLAPKPRKPPK